MRLVLALVLTCLALPAATVAGTTASYVNGDGKRLVLDVGDNGAIRIGGVEPQQYGIIENDELYLVETRSGAPKVARLRDISAAFDQVMGPMLKGLFDAAAKAPAPRAGLRIEKGSATSFAGFQGRNYRITGIDTGNPSRTVDWIVSTDPALAPVGRGLQMFLESTMVLAAPFLGPQTNDMIADIRRTFALGTPLSAPGQFQIETVKPADFPEGHFTLPAVPQTVEDIVGGMKQGMQQAAEALAPAK